MLKFYHQVHRFMPCAATIVNCDLNHVSVIEMDSNIYIYELLLKIVDDDTLKDTYWPHNVDKILKKYNLPGIKHILKSEPITKSAYKGIMNTTVLDYHYAISETRIMKSKLYRFIYRGDFSFMRKTLHPLVSTK